MKVHFRRIPITTRITAYAIIGAVLTALAVGVIASLFVSTDWRARTVARHESNLRVVMDYLNPKGEPYSLRDGQLYAGDHNLEVEGNAIVDRLQGTLGVVVSVFRQDTRVATTVKDKEGKRPLGTKFTKGIIEDQVYMKGLRYTGEAMVVGIPYLLAYEPLRDVQGTIVGAVGVGMPMSDYEDTIASLYTRIGLAALVIVLFVSISIYLLVGRGMGALRQLSGTVSAMAAGDLQVTVPDTDLHDDIGRIAQAVENLRLSLLQGKEIEARHRASEEDAARKRQRVDQATETFVQRIDGVVAAVESSARRMRSSAQELSSVANSTMDRATESNAAVERGSADMQVVAAAAEQLISSIDDISRQVGTAAEHITRAKEGANHTSEMVHGLASAVGRIGDVIKLINAVASQTNLLALNATIEAARAGDAGKGFAVVAGEVKGLATQTAKATDDIQKQIALVQAETERTVSAIMQILTMIDEIHGATAAVVNSVQKQQSSTQEIVASVQSASESVQNAAGNVAAVREDAVASGHSAGSVYQATEELLSQSNDLSREVTEFVHQVRSA